MKIKRAGNRFLSLLICMVLITAAALMITGCQENTDNTASYQAAAETADETGNAVSFTLTVTDGEGNKASFPITTEKKTVGEALIDEGLIEGEEGDYGLYVTKVNGMTADFEKDGTYWAFYIDGEYAMAGVDQTDIVEGTVYSLNLEK